ncbi:MAG: hypothetical protein HRF46_00750 [Acidobacteriota bacterium]|jgi:hypothetical protein
MVSVARTLLDGETRRGAPRAAAARVELALELGEDDLEIFCRARRLPPEEGRRQLRRARQVGRAPCRCLTESL